MSGQRKLEGPGCSRNRAEAHVHIPTRCGICSRFFKRHFADHLQQTSKVLGWPPPYCRTSPRLTYPKVFQNPSRWLHTLPGTCLIQGAELRSCGRQSPLNKAPKILSRGVGLHQCSSPESRAIKRSASDIGKGSNASLSVGVGSISGNDGPSAAQAFDTLGNADQPQMTAQTGALVRRHPVDPQVIYPPKACIFVANLNATHDDAILKAELHKMFRQFGDVYVKIKRDKRRMPFAFCQFTQVSDARLAREHANDRLMLGRKLRVEEVRANLTFAVYKKSGDRTLLHEAQIFLEKYGPISKVETLEEHIQVSLGLPPCVIVMFEKFDSHRDILGATRDHPIYMVIPHYPENDGPIAFPSTLLRDQLYKDSRSIYMGNLPPCTNEALIHLLVAPSGTVVEIQLMHSSNGNATHFAFVMFESEESPDRAVDRCDGQIIQGHTIRVQRKKRQNPKASHVSRASVSGGPTSGFHESRWLMHRRGPSASPSTGGRHHRRLLTAGPWSGPPNAVTLRPLAGPSSETQYSTNAPSELATQAPGDEGDTVGQALLPTSTQAHHDPAVTHSYPQHGMTEPYAEQTSPVINRKISVQSYSEPAVARSHQIGMNGPSSGQVSNGVNQDTIAALSISEHTSSRARELAIAQKDFQLAVTQHHAKPALPEANRELVETRIHSKPTLVQTTSDPAASPDLAQSSSPATPRPAALQPYRKLAPTCSYSYTAKLAADRAEQAAGFAETADRRRRTASPFVIGTHRETSGDESQFDAYSAGPAQSFASTPEESPNPLGQEYRLVQRNARPGGLSPRSAHNAVMSALDDLQGPDDSMPVVQPSQPFTNAGYPNNGMYPGQSMPPPMAQQGISLPTAMAHGLNPLAPMYPAPTHMPTMMPQMHHQLQPYASQGLQMPFAMVPPTMPFGYPPNIFQQHFSNYNAPQPYQTPQQYRASQQYVSPSSPTDGQSSPPQDFDHPKFGH